MVYIGQTIGTVKDRWRGHKTSSRSLKKTTPLYNAMRKYGVDKFSVEEIGGANSMSELNYIEFIETHKQNTIWPNGYNMREGGGNIGKRSDISRQIMSAGQKEYFKHNDSVACKKVTNIKTGQIWKSLQEASSAAGINYSTLRAKLQGKNGNNTDLRYLGEEDKSKPFSGSGSNNWSSKVTVNITTKQTWKNAKLCWEENKEEIKCNKNSFNAMLNGSKTNETDFRYLGMEHVCKNRIREVFSQVVDIITGQKWESLKKCSKELNMTAAILGPKLLGKRPNETNLRYVGMEHVCKKRVGSGRHVPVVNVKTGEKFKTITDAAKSIGTTRRKLEERLNGRLNHTAETAVFEYLNPRK